MHFDLEPVLVWLHFPDDLNIAAFQANEIPYKRVPIGES
jgi:hypothetical protein